MCRGSWGLRPGHSIEVLGKGDGLRKLWARLGSWRGCVLRGCASVAARGAAVGSSRFCIISTFYAHLPYLAGIPFVGMKSQHMPWEALAEAATAVRRVARLLRSVSATLGQGFERDMQVHAALRLCCAALVYTGHCTSHCIAGAGLIRHSLPTSKPIHVAAQAMLATWSDASVPQPPYPCSSLPHPAIWLLPASTRDPTPQQGLHCNPKQHLSLPPASATPTHTTRRQPYPACAQPIPIHPEPTSNPALSVRRRCWGSTSQRA